MPNVTKVWVEPDFKLGMFHNVLLMDQARMARVPDIQRVEKTYRQALEVHARVLGLVCIAPVDGEQDKAVNKASEDMMRALGNRILAVALVFPGDDMRATMFRTVIRGINIFTKGTSLRPCRTELEGATILAPLASAQLGRPVTAQELIEALAELRAMR